MKLKIEDLKIGDRVLIQDYMMKTPEEGTVVVLHEKGMYSCIGVMFSGKVDRGLYHSLSAYVEDVKDYDKNVYFTRPNSLLYTLSEENGRWFGNSDLIVCEYANLPYDPNQQADTDDDI